MRRVLACAIAVVSIAPPAGRAEDDPVVPAGHPRRAVVAPLCPPGCPPGSTLPGIYPPGVYPGVPGAMPGMPPGTTPGTPPGGMPGAPPGAQPPGMPPGAEAPAPGMDQLTSPFAQPTEAGGQAARTFNENFDGDFGGIFYRTTVLVGPAVPASTTQRVVVDAAGNKQVITINVPAAPGTPREVLIPVGSRYNGIQITDNDNPRPTDRAYFGYSFYDDIGASLNPGVGGGDLQRQIAGFEKTFLNGDASFGMRLPFVQQYGPGLYGNQVVGDLTLLWKYALVNNRQTGDVLSGGFVLTTPTGGDPGLVLVDGSSIPHSWLFQPWVGFIRTFDRAYLMGISNMIVPSNSRDVTLWGNSLGAGYWLYRDPGQRILTGIIPSAEVHVRTPLDHRNRRGLVYMQDQVNLTTGLHFRFTRATLSGAVCVPLAGPRPWAIEAMGYVNYYF
jgi:hypothetical protein